MRPVPAAALLALALAGCRPGSRSDLASADPARRAAAVESLAGARDDEAMAALLVAQQDPHPAVRAAAAATLGARGGPRAVEALSVLLGDPDPEVATAAARGLASVRAPGPGADARASAEVAAKAARALALAYGRGDTRTRTEIAAALQSLGASLREAIEAEARRLWEQNVRELRSGTGAGRSGAAEELGRSGRAEAVRVLLPLVEEEDVDPGLAAAAARGLGWAGDRGAVDALASALRGRDGRVSEAAAWALGRVGDPSAAEPLAEAGIRGPSRVARRAVAALESMPDAPAVGLSLCEVANRSTDPATATAAAAAARERAAECPERPLAQRIGRGGADAQVALGVLGALGLPPERLRLPAERAVALLTTGGADGRTRAAAARALGNAPYPAAVAALKRRQAAIEERAARAARAPGTRPEVAEPGDVEELIEISVALSRLEPERPAALATRMASSEDPRLRTGAARSFGAARSPGVVEVLTPLATDTDPGVRSAARTALGTMGEAGVQRLARVLASGPVEPEDLDGIARALGATGHPSAVPLLASMLGGSATPAAVAALGALGDRAAIPALLAALRGPGALGRVGVVEALGQLGATEAAASLTGELLSDRPEVRAAAARALGKMRHEPAGPTLEALRSDYYAEVRRAALEAVARLPSGPVRRP